MFLPQYVGLLICPVLALRTELQVEVPQQFRQNQSYLMVGETKGVSILPLIRNGERWHTSFRGSFADQLRRAGGHPYGRRCILFLEASARE